MASSGFRPNPHAEIRANSENCVRICDTHSIREISSSRNRMTKSFESHGFHANRSTQKFRRDLKVTFWSQKSRFNSTKPQINVSISAGYWCYFTQSNALEYHWGSEHSKGTPWSDSDQFGCTQWLTPPSKTEIEMSRCQIPDTHFDLELIFSVCLFWVCLVGFLYSFGSKRTKTISQKQFGQIWQCQWCFRVRIRLNCSRC